jgi:ElaB/YqjD/DUF883 family membrane-anchored ribosome-binding protein
MQQPPNQNGGAGSEIRDDAKQLGATAADRLHSEVDARKATAANQAQSVSSAVRQAADGLDESSPDWLKSAFRQGAQQIQRLADSVEQKDSRQLMSDAQDFARNNPGTFLAACAAVGFAAARVLKAGGAQQDGQQDGQQSGGTQSFGGSPAYRDQAQGQAGSPPHGTDLAYGSGTEAGIRADAPGEFA